MAPVYVLVMLQQTNAELGSPTSFLMGGSLNFVSETDIIFIKLNSVLFVPEGDPKPTFQDGSQSNLRKTVLKKELSVWLLAK